ncbi:MAG: (Fe-S)-binding protein [Chloroflexi bacterium]|nr:(Fe-S)-binding protein [Chloroflexota bacterium]
MSDQEKRIALFVTCVVDQILPEVGVDTVKVLRRAGCAVDFPPEQTCCGQPFFNSGFQEEARRLARRTIDAFADQDIVVLPSGSCTTMIRQEYPHLLENEPKYYYRALRLAKKTFELSEFLAKEAKWPAATAVPTPQPEPITYHDSCHMCRLLGLKNEPRHTLQAAGYAIQEMTEPDRCCGFGGLFSVRMPEVSNAMTAEKLRQAQATQAAALVTADPGCLMQMRGLTDGRQPIEHIATMLERATR